MSPPSAPAVVVEALAASLGAASDGNPNDMERPAAALWTDRDSRWGPSFHNSALSCRSCWRSVSTTPRGHRPGDLAAVRDRPGAGISRDPFRSDPIVYLPGAGRLELGAADACPNRLKPLIDTIADPCESCSP